MKEIKFGIIGTGSIASKFSMACGMTQGASAYAVSSRDLEKAQAYAAANGIEKAYGSAEEMVRDGQIDCIYVATPHPIHFENCMLALENGKPVLCEKPMVMNRKEAEQLFETAKARNLFIMEGMWTRYLPNTIKVMEWIRGGAIGKIKFIDMIFSFSVDMNAPKHRLVNPALGGGSMYDLGVYTVEMASHYVGANPIAYSGFHTDFVCGSDATAVMAVKYPGDILATMRTGITCNAPCMATILGDKGRIEIPKFYLANEARLIVDEKVVSECRMEYEVPEGLTWQLKEVCRYLREGVTESPVVPFVDTLKTAEILSDMMAQFYPDYYGGK